MVPSPPVALLTIALIAIAQMTPAAMIGLPYVQRKTSASVTTRKVPGLSTPALIRNSASTNPPQVCVTSFQDDFLPSALQSGWEWIDPNSDIQQSLTTRPGSLHLHGDGALSNRLDYEDMDAARLLRPVAADKLAIMASVEITLFNDSQNAGILIWQDSANYSFLINSANGRLIFHNVTSDVIKGREARGIEGEIELRLENNETSLDAMWRLPDGPWNPLGSGDRMTGTVLVGPMLYALTGSDVDAYFGYFRTQVCSPPASVSYLPHVERGINVISGTVSHNAGSRAEIDLELRSFASDNPSAPSTLIATTSVDSSYGFSFDNPPITPAGQKYYIVFRNRSTERLGLLGLFIGKSFVKTGRPLQLPHINLGDINLQHPVTYPPDTPRLMSITLPQEFSWSRLTGAGESFRLVLEDGETGKVAFVSPSLPADINGTVNFMLTNRPDGVATAPTYYFWYIMVDSPAGSGYSRYFGVVEFSN